MSCGKDYAHMLVTEDGKTPDDPWDWFAGPLDYDAWYDVAHRVGREVFRQWSWLLSVAGSRFGGMPKASGSKGTADRKAPRLQ